MDKEGLIFGSSLLNITYIVRSLASVLGKSRTPHSANCNGWKDQRP